MSAMAAANLCIKCVIFTPEAGSPASHVPKTIIAQYDDAEALEEFARLCDVITYEFENIVTTIEALKPLTPVYPDSNLLDIAQDRIQEKAYEPDRPENDPLGGGYIRAGYPQNARQLERRRSDYQDRTHGL